MEAQGLSLRRVARFVRDRYVVLLLAPLLVISGTIVHEAAHAAAAVAGGGTVLGWRVLPELGPGGLSFGQVVHDGAASPWLVLPAPSLAALIMVAAGLALAARIHRPRIAEAVLLLLVVLPLIDLSMSLAGLFLGQPGSDLHRLLAGRETLAGIAMALLFPGAGVLLGRRLQAAAPGALSAAELGAGYAALLAAPWVVAATTGLRLGG